MTIETSKSRQAKADSSPVSFRLSTFRSVEFLRTLGLIGILTIAVMRCMIVFAPQVLFDVDPAIDGTPLLGLGPAGSLCLDVLLLLACAIALLGEWLSGRGLNWLVMLLALIPMPIMLWHGSSDAGDLWLGSTWATAAIACAALAHLARERSFRIISMAVLLAAIVPVLARGVVQIVYEHPATITFYEEHKDEILRERGWSPNSPAAQIYERRLREPQPLGWFSTSNILASLAAFGFVAWIGLAIAAARAKLQSGWAAAMVLCALFAGALLWLSGSKGAALAALAGLLMILVPLILPRWLGGTRTSPSPLRERVGVRVAPLRWQHSPRLGSFVILLIALALLGVIVRGTLLPESFANEKSLLFRWHYMIASARIVLDHAWLGVGPDGFQAAYMLHRVPRNPEEVASAHSMFLDWLCTLGISGAAWIGLVMLLLTRFRSETIRKPTNEAPVRHSHILENVRMSPHSDHRSVTRVLVAVAVAAFVPSLFIEYAALDGTGGLVRALGIAGFVCVAIMVSSIASHASDHTSRAAWIAGIASLLVHGQIEMTFVQPGAVVWCFCALGAIGMPELKGKGVFNLVWVAAIVCAAGWIAFNGTIPAIKQERSMRSAAVMLEPVRAKPDEVQVMLAQRVAASEELVRAYHEWPINVQPLNAAAIQLELACSLPAGPQPIGLLLRARDLLDLAILTHDDSSSLAIAVGINVRLARVTDDPEHWSRAIDLSRQITQRDPHGLGAWKRFGDVLWAADERREAASAYQRALECDENFALDELKRLSNEDRSRLIQRIKEISST